MNPTKAKNEKDQPDKNSAIKEPLIANGMAEKIINGWVIDLNCSTKTANIKIKAVANKMPKSPKLSVWVSYSPPI